MTVGNWLKNSTGLLVQAGIETARLDCLVLLEDNTNKDRAWLLAHPEFEIPAEQLSTLHAQLARRVRHEPLAYIRGHAEFYGRTFVLSDNVLVPRPETEAIIELSKELLVNTKFVHVADIGTGSGCIGITLQLEFPALAVDLYDIDESALAVAKLNAERLGVTVELQTSDVLIDITGVYQFIVCNLPYVPEAFSTNKAATYEPPIALFSGKDGLDHYRAFWSQLNGWVQKPLFVIAESLPQQHKAHTQLARAAGYELSKTLSYVQQFALSAT